MILCILVVEFLFNMCYVHTDKGFVECLQHEKLEHCSIVRAINSDTCDRVGAHDAETCLIKELRGLYD